MGCSLTLASLCVVVHGLTHNCKHNTQHCTLNALACLDQGGNWVGA